MPTVQVVSDVHVEFHADGGRAFTDSLDADGVDVLVVAGDLASYPTLGGAIDLLCDRFRDVVYVAGNHEYYHSNPTDVHALLAGRAERRSNFHWLHNRAVELAGLRFVGTTLWFADDPRAEPLRVWMNDFRQIDDFVPWVFEQNAEARQFLSHEVRAGDIVVTHHLPDKRSVHPKYADSPLNPFFVCDVSEVIEQNEPELWIHGHTHERVDYTLCATRVVANPHGYVGYESQDHFDRRLRFTL